MMNKLICVLVATVCLLAACHSNQTQKSGDAAAATQADNTANATSQAAEEPPKPVSVDEQTKIDVNKIATYLKDKGLEAESTESGIHYIIEKEGDGKNPTEDMFVSVHYKGELLDGTQFDSSYDRGEPATFSLRGVIKGWQEGIPLLKVGGKGKLLIPSGLAYGKQGRPQIPANSVLVFDVELLEAMSAEEKEAKEAAAAKEQTAKEISTIEAYLKENNLKAKKTESGIHYVVEKPGSGPNPTQASTVEVHYKGTLLDGTKFDSSYDRGQTATFPLGRVVKGWQEGIPLFKKGGKGTLIIPSSLGYGKRGMPPKIPPSSILRFDIELVDIKQ